eukprot:COSAG06_NODE_2030_length_7782_cov_5.203429_3_plen_51_part_00
MLITRTVTTQRQHVLAEDAFFLPVASHPQHDDVPLGAVLPPAVVLPRRTS